MLIDWVVETICGLQQEGEDLVLATVLKKSGSAPCLAGAKMIVRSDGTSIGSVGGGALEAGALKVAGQVASTRTARIMRFNLTGTDAANMQMICGGQVEVLVEHIPCTPANVEVFQALQSGLSNGEKCYLIADLGLCEDSTERIGRCVAREDGSIAGEFPFQPGLLDNLKGRAFSSAYPVVVDTADRRFFVERCFTPSTVYIFGAGHVSQKLAILAAMAAFRVVVLDDRAEFANRDRFPDADEVVALDSFDRYFSGLAIDNDSFVVIVTRGHLHDGTVLKQALGTKARYIGMMGSKRKRDELFKLFAQDGFGDRDLERVHCPIGLEIKAETQIEIAFSIVSELILARAQSAEAA
ncbi:MAG: XdhC family protein [Geobacteraceae bacterium]|nr:XdhC family protein [Geobacteraceae bacterium]